jgi:hypothetical protein
MMQLLRNTSNARAMRLINYSMVKDVIYTTISASLLMICHGSLSRGKSIS